MIHNFRLIFLLFITSTIIGGCNNKDSVPIAAEAGAVEIIVHGVKDALLQSDIEPSAAKASIARYGLVSDKVNNQQTDFDGFSWELSAESSASANRSQKLASASSSTRGNSTLKSAAGRRKMDSGKKFRILFYEVRNGNEIFASSAEISVSSTRYIEQLYNNITYKWYAYSYDDVSSIPLPSDTNNPEIPTRTNLPFLFDSGTFTTSLGTTSRVDIEFEHQIAKVEVKVDAEQMFANNFVALTANFVALPLVTKTFGLKSGSLSAAVINTTTTNQVITFAADGSLAIQKSTNALYTAAILPSIEVSFSNIVYNKSGMNISLVSPTSPKLALITGFNNDVRLIKRALINLKYKGGVIGDKEWAQGILYYDPSDPRNPYKISEPFMSGTTHACNYYWNWNSLKPRSITGSTTTEFGDPCREVLPKNTWRTPTRQDFSGLNIAIANNPRNGAVYFDADNGERVYFHEAGWITNNTCSPSNTNDGIYWSSEARNTTNGYALEIDERGGTGAGNEITDYLKTYGVTIKCVRQY
ncbi:MAG: hypothetical protein ACI35Z_08230 [Sphingobacterium hotanense]